MTAASISRRPGAAPIGAARCSAWWPTSKIRKRTDNRVGLQHALRAILEDGGTLEHRWSIREALKTGDRATGVTC